MKIVSISQDFFDLVEGDREFMLKHNRPCIVVVRLRFRGKQGLRRTAAFQHRP